MTDKTQIFISYKTGIDDGLTQTAHSIRMTLESKGYEVWMDKSKLVPGENWDTQIYEAIAKSDLVLLLLAEPTAKSEWVRREIDVARGGQVFIIPVVIREGFDFGPALEQFAIPKTQAFKLGEGSNADFARLIEAVEQNKDKTRKRQAEWLKALQAGMNQPIVKQPARTNKTHTTYRLQEHDCKIHLATGDITRMRDIDVFVNPENSYLQMARLFETSSVSSKLRLQGSHINGSGHLLEDTVQLELYKQILSEYPLPVSFGQVIPTRAGHPESEIIKVNHARYIFHVVTVMVQQASGSDNIIPISNNLITRAFENCMRMVLRIDRKEGVFEPEENYRPIESIIFPMFATGQGRRQSDISEVAYTISSAIRDYLTGNDDAQQIHLKNIHLCAYSEQDLGLVREQMDRVFKN